MRKGIGPQGLGALKSPAKQTMLDKAREIDRNINKKIQTANIKPPAKEGSFQEFVNDGPVPFVRRGYNKAKKQAKKEWNATKKVAGKIYNDLFE